ncbi:LytR C-terminal domain-containing protein [Pseudonocardia sp. H11422]|uniref:LytR C-terminal domain-containing protein n=1 Tax=Pseudonocardia sp. H11422 TaxID=2835866 RepID=UPI001BDC475D|nr:LytR C-terminal domain-containing protein [Pseudonocardia sp. H11422]
MTAPASPGGSSPLRIGGFALLGVGVVAGVIGLATLATGGDDGSSTAAATSTEVSATAPAEPPAAAAPAPSGEVPLPSFAATPTAGIAAPPSTSPPPAAGAEGSAGSGGGIAAPRGGGAPVVRAPIRVYNNSTITGLAARAADDFRSSGWAVESVANYPSGIIPTSTVYYRPGTNELAAAQSLANQFGLRVEPRFEGLDDASPGVIVIVTNDYQRR